MVSAGILAFGLLGAPPAEAGAPTDALRGVFLQVNTVLSEPALRGEPDRQMAACRALFGSVFDFRGAARYSLGREWQAHTAREQELFTGLFGDLIGLSYVQWLASTADVDPKIGVRVRYVSETVDRDTALVRTAIAGRGGREVAVSYDMVYGSGRWMVRDVRVDDVSLLANYRAQFARIMRDFSYSGLLSRIEALRAGRSQALATAGTTPNGTAAPNGVAAGGIRIWSPQAP